MNTYTWVCGRCGVQLAPQDFARYGVGYGGVAGCRDCAPWLTTEQRLDRLERRVGLARDRDFYIAPPPQAIKVEEGDPPHPAPDDSLALAIEGSRQTVLEVIESAPDVNAVNSVSLRLTTVEAIFEWYVATLRAAAEAKRLELGGAPKPQG